MTQLKQARKESREMAWRQTQGHTKDIGDSNSQPSRARLRRSFTTREAEILVRGIDPYMSSKQKSIKSMFSKENIKKVKKFISNFFFYNAIPFNAAGSDFYYQAMISLIA